MNNACLYDKKYKVHIQDTSFPELPLIALNTEQNETEIVALFVAFLSFFVTAQCHKTTICTNIHTIKVYVNR